MLFLYHANPIKIFRVICVACLASLLYLSDAFGRITCDHLVSEAGAVCEANFSSPIAPSVIAWASQVGMSVILVEDAVVPSFRMTPYQSFLELKVPGNTTVNISQTVLYDTPFRKINDSNQNTTVVRLRRPFQGKEFCAFVCPGSSHEVYAIPAPGAAGLLEEVEGSQGKSSVGWFLGGFYAITQLIGWIATPIYLMEVYGQDRDGEVCHCSGIVAYIFTTGLAAIPHLLVWFYVKHKRRLPESQPLLRPEA